MDGINFKPNENYSIIEVETLSDDIKASIRTHLSSICYGESQAASGRTMFNYRATLTAFLDRYNSKERNHQIGMIGELLAHILIVELLPQFKTVSLFFNLEEKQIKKGFDVLLYSGTDNDVWITEVKSGELHKDKNSDQTTKDLLASARLDLKKRLNENEVNHWTNAIHSARVALGDNTDYKDVVINLLADEGDIVTNKKATSFDNNVFLVSSLFTEADDSVSEETLSAFHQKLLDKPVFKNAILLSIKKSAYSKVVDFFEEEVTSA